MSQASTWLMLVLQEKWSFDDKNGPRNLGLLLVKGGIRLAMENRWRNELLATDIHEGKTRKTGMKSAFPEIHYLRPSRSGLKLNGRNMPAPTQSMSLCLRACSTHSISAHSIWNNFRRMLCSANYTVIYPHI